MDDKQFAIAEALGIAARYGSVDGAHHKAWVIDQMVRALTQCPTITVTAKDCAGRKYQYEALGESAGYLELIARHNDGPHGPDTYEWDAGIAP